jgi:hypothetical protein
MFDINKNMLKEIVNYNKKVIEKYENSESKAINEMIILNYEGHSIWNPFKDESLRFNVDPEEKYGKKELKKFILMYKNMKSL